MNKDEFLSIVDDNWNEIGKESRSIVYEKGMNNYRVVNFFVVNDRLEFLIQKRSADGTLFPGKFDFSCGEHVLYGEKNIDAAVRGLYKELGIKIYPEEIKSVMKLTPLDGVSSYQEIYFCHRNKDFKPNIKEGVESIEFMSLGLIRYMISQNKSQFKPDFPIVFEKSRSYLLYGNS